MTLGEKISSLRKNKGLSQEMLAEKCGISLRTVQRIENNKSIPRPFTLKVIADALSIHIEQLVSNPNSEIHDESSLSKINLINSSALLGILVPLLNIIAPALLWWRNKENPLVNAKAKKIISFQVCWLIITSAILFTTHFLHYKLTGEFVTGRVSIQVVVYLFLLLINAVFIIYNTMQLSKGNADIYPFTPNLF